MTVIPASALFCRMRNLRGANDWRRRKKDVKNLEYQGGKSIFAKSLWDNRTRREADWAMPCNETGREKKEMRPSVAEHRAPCNDG